MTTWIHGSEGVRWRGGRRVAVRRQDDAQVDRDWPEEGISAVSSVSSVRRTNASRRQEQLRVSSSEERQGLRQGGLAMGFVRGDLTRRRSCLLRGQHKSKKLHSNRLHQTCGPPWGDGSWSAMMTAREDDALYTRSARREETVVLGDHQTTRK